MQFIKILKFGLSIRDICGKFRVVRWCILMGNRNRSRDRLDLTKIACNGMSPTSAHSAKPCSPRSHSKTCSNTISTWPQVWHTPISPNTPPTPFKFSISFNCPETPITVTSLTTCTFIQVKAPVMGKIERNVMPIMRKWMILKPGWSGSWRSWPVWRTPGSRKMGDNRIRWLLILWLGMSMGWKGVWLTHDWWLCLWISR